MATLNQKQTNINPYKLDIIYFNRF